MTPSTHSDPVLADVLDFQKSTPPAEPAKVEPPVEPAKVEPPAAAAEPAKAEPVVDPAKEPAKEPVAAEPAKVEPPKAEEPKFDVAKYLETESKGVIKSTSDLERIIKERNDLEQKLKAAPVLGDYSVKLDSWIKKGNDPKLFHVIHDLPVDEMSAEQIVKAGLRLQNPSWSEEGIDMLVKDQYGLLTAEDEGYNEQKVKIGQMKLEQDSRGYLKDLKELQAMTHYSEEDNTVAIKAEDDRQTAWKTNLPKLVNDFSKISLPLDDKGTTMLDIAISVEERAAIANSIQNQILNAPILYDENGIKAVSNAIRDHYITNNINKIASLIASNSRTAVVEEKIKVTHNPSGLPPAEVTPLPTKDKAQESYEKTVAFLEA